MLWQYSGRFESSSDIPIHALFSYASLDLEDQARPNSMRPPLYPVAIYCFRTTPGSGLIYLLLTIPLPADVLIRMKPEPLCKHNNRSQLLSRDESMRLHAKV